MTKRTKMLLSGSLIAGVLALAGMASADTKTLHGSTCRSNQSEQSVTSTTTSTRNLSTDFLKAVTCPIERDNTGNNNGLSELKMVINNNGETNQITLCGASALSSNGSVIKQVVKQPNPGTGITTLNWGNTLNMSNNAASTYAIECFLGPRAEIFSIFYNEP